MTHLNSHGRMGLVAAGIALVAACALNDPPTDETPPTGGLPPGVSAAPAAPQTGPVTSPLPAVASTEQPPVMGGQPLGNLVPERGPRVAVDSTTRWFGARLDSVIAYGNRDLTQMPIPLARSLIQSIGGALQKSNVTRVRNVAVELDSLDMLLAQTPINGPAVGRSLRRLSGRAAAASPEAGVLAGRVAHLADVLEAAGNKLANGR